MQGRNLRRHPQGGLHSTLPDEREWKASRGHGEQDHVSQMSVGTGRHRRTLGDTKRQEIQRYKDVVMSGDPGQHGIGHITRAGSVGVRGSIAVPAVRQWTDRNRLRRAVGRRDCLDRMLIFNEVQLEWVLVEYESCGVIAVLLRRSRFLSPTGSATRHGTGVAAESRRTSTTRRAARAAATRAFG